MNFNGLLSFVEVLKKNKQIIEINEYVSTELEITEIVDRISKQADGGKALLFINNGTKFPLLINALGSINRMQTALGVKNLDDFGTEIFALLKDFTANKTGIFDQLRMLPKLKEISSWLPKIKNIKASSQEVIIKNPNLDILPILKCWPHDGGRFITLPTVYTKDPSTGIRNVGMYRMQVIDAQTTAMHWHKHKTGARHYEEYKKLNKKMPVAVVLGGDPIYTYVATAPLPDNIDELMLAGFIKKQKITLVKCITQDIEIPEDADIVLEGYVDTQEEMFFEGPFGDHTGFYSLADFYPKFHLTCITHRLQAIYPATIVGIPPQEDKYIAKATERLFLPLIKMTMAPEIIDMNMPEAGVAHNITIVKIKKSFSGQAMKVANALWGAGQMMFNKIMLIVDENVTDIQNIETTIQQSIKFFSPKNDTHFSRGPLDVLDHSSSKFAFGSKLLLDATKKYEEEIVYADKIYSDNYKINNTNFSEIAEIKNVNFHFIEKQIPILFLSVEKNDNIKNIAKKIIENTVLENVKIVFIMDKNVDISNMLVTIWLAANNIEPERDVFLLEDDNQNILFIDGTTKSKKYDNFNRDWPNILIMKQEIINSIDAKWDKMSLGSLIKSPSLSFIDMVKNNDAVLK